MVSLRPISQEPPAEVLRKGYRVLSAWMLAGMMLILIAFPAVSAGDPLDWNGFGSAGVEVWLTRMDGRAGFARETGATGTLNDFRDDLGIPGGNTTFRLLASLRPLEHHLVRLFGSIPETYRGEKQLERQLRTRNNVYEPNTIVKSETRYGMFGFGYDLDFLVGPRWFGGLHGDLRYLDFRFRIRGETSGLEDTAVVAEVTPCIGAHVQGRLPVVDQRFPGLGVGLFSRMTYGMTPNFLNYYDITTGVAFTVAPGGLVAVDLKAAYALEGLAEENISGKDVQFHRDGLMFSVQAAF
ncbi:MAG: hypothetical protein HY913_24135 [Desulfomonile tiedjei]|nr:hypothetical protein [Desulfomonile tiedjei]